MAEFNDVPPTLSYSAPNLMFQAGVTSVAYRAARRKRAASARMITLRAERWPHLLSGGYRHDDTVQLQSHPLFHGCACHESVFPHIQKMAELGITTGYGSRLLYPAR